jgi:glycosyltransferase involved in cell wall biosynthesis
VAFFSPGWPPELEHNGIVTYIGNLRPALGRLGIDTHVIASQEGPSSDPVAVDLSKTRPPISRRLLTRALARIPRAPASTIAWGWSIAQTLTALKAQRGLDLLEMEESFGAAWYAQQGLDLPVVVRLHGPLFLNGAALGRAVDDDFRRTDRAEGRCIADAVAVTAPSRDVLDRVRDRYGLPLSNARVIPNPAPDIPPHRRWRLEACDRKTMLFVGRFDRHKGGDVVIDAFRAVAEALPEAELAFVGPDRGLRDDAGKTHDLPGYVDARLPPAIRARTRILGALSRDHIETLRRQAFVTVVASRYENFPLALAESLAFGCPTVASNVGGIPEVLLGDRTGLIFSAGDASDLATKVLALYRNPERAAALGSEAARDAAQRLSPDAVARLTRDCYDAIWRAHSRPRARRDPRRILYSLTSLV